MKNYLRILKLASPLGRFVPPYMIYSLLQIVFSIVNFSLLIPLLNVIFGIGGTQTPTKVATEFTQTFSFDVTYFKALFYFYFDKILVSEGQAGALKFVCIIIVITVLLSNIFRFLSQTVIVNLRTHVMYNLRKLIYGSIINQDILYFNNEKKGNLLTKVSMDCAEIEMSIIASVSIFTSHIIKLISILVILFTMSSSLTLFTLITLPISGILISEISKRLKHDAFHSANIQGNLMSIIDETISGIKVVKGFNGIKHMINKYDFENKSFVKIFKRVELKLMLSSPISEFFGVLTVTGILYFGGLLVLSNKGDLGPSEFITYIILFWQLTEPAKAISSGFSNISKGLVSAQRIFDLTDQVPQVQEKQNAIDIQSFNNKIEFKNLSFSYTNKPVLIDINFEIKKGQTVALVGQSGSGKSTLADLLTRFIVPSEGQILLDGTPIEDISFYSLRTQMGIVTQEPLLFNDTIFNNIAFGKENISEEQVVQAAKIANAHDFIIQSEKGYQTIIGERGANLSGGQRQRLSIARAILHNPPILILDEATSALDTESEKLVQEALTNLMKDRTSLVIAHRLSTIQNADLIIVMQDGKIVERGTHDELLANQHIYHMLTNMQSKN